jgi:hypothetical protein
MDERHLILDRKIRKDLEVMESLWRNLESVAGTELPDEPKELVFVGYQLHNLYNAAENVFRNVAFSFGNQLDDHSGWHAELLDRMRLDLLPLRPALIDDASFEQLDELRRFRHLFRAAYGVELDAERLSLVLRRAMALRQRFPRQIETFLEFVAGLE